jgi:hypothetical protein
MVSGTKILLVTCIALAISSLFFYRGFYHGPASMSVVASDYDAYWLWAGVNGRPEIEKAKTIYLHVGEINKNAHSDTQIIPQSGVQPSFHQQNIWLVYRVRTLDWTPTLINFLMDKYESWRLASPHVLGIQIDFDGGTKNLHTYSDFLHKLRSDLPQNCMISITGLMDWAANADPLEINNLSKNVDEIIFQTYKKSETVNNIDLYLHKMEKIQIPFKVGLIEGGSWPLKHPIEQNSHFRGYVIFLRNNVKSKNRM